ncbi:autotransporter outer membrane beta-barrel domain-containing protein [uncultured Roseibium sp.]|uniref:autotransporter outer membrane beta-barrel domain-containing protein n=1 Tax=uncultured Roseibium sp. TaxID=1936171 RepID=UPI002611B539|nr:autotransporter outer membrane beta-barrel domain-containing protein [uncultured Roseibium sp.]
MDPGDASVAMEATNNTNLLYQLFGGASPVAWYFGTTAGPGKDDGDAGSAGWLKIYNNGTFDTQVSNTGYKATMYLRSVGGDGDQDNSNYKSNGGHGGSGGAITLQTADNAGYYVSESAVDGFAVFDAETSGGMGGEQNSGAAGDQFGGDGGDGGAITITSGAGSFLNVGASNAFFEGLDTGGGIVAKSIGGQGGYQNGNAGAGGAISITGSLNTQLYWYLSGTGGTGLFGLSALSQGGVGYPTTDNSDRGGFGGDGGAVTITNDAPVVLEVQNGTPAISAAIAARSKGGAGGQGPSKDESGGNGGTGGNITLGMSGTSAEIRTTGDYVYGILGQSIGGLGGSGGDSTALAGTGGGGGFGGNAGNIVLTLSGTSDDKFISTTGDYAAGIVLHSVGGGGGTGSDFVSVLGGQGGNGGNGGDAGSVTVNSDMGIQTASDHAFGMVAQSIAGSGGAGGIDTSTVVGLGGDGAGGGLAGVVTINSSGDITTQGFNSSGIIAQSIGGGGGAAGSSSGLVSIGGNAAGSTSSSGGSVGISNTGTISSAGDSSIGILAQSIGGGGGSGGDSAGVTGVGGQGAAGGSGGQIAVANIGTILTSGDYAAGGIFQSIGGGGGNGGGVLTISEIASIGIGGSASQGGAGGQICIDNTASCGFSGLGSLAVSTGAGNANVKTTGEFAPGLIAQSIGGGGGNGGSVKNFSALSFLALQTGGNAGAGGNGAKVALTQNDLQITTSSAQSAGILAQSIGGGGGTGGSANYFDATIGFNAAFIVGGSGGTGGAGGAVSIDLSDSTIATGLVASNTSEYGPNNSVGVLAQSIGGGGGNGGSTSAGDLVVAAPTGTGVPIAFNYVAAVGGNGGNAGNGGTVTVSYDQDSGLTTIGDASHGVLAQSIGGGGGNGGDASALSATLGDKDTVEATSSVALGGGAGNILNSFNPDYAYATSGGGAGGQVNVVLGTYGAASNSTNTTATKLTTLAPDGTLLTIGDGSHGLLAQSIGGGGGNGGLGNSNAYAQGGIASLKAKISLGGQGGFGGDGNAVTVHNFAGHTIQTQGSGAKGMVAQSIGGGGGNSQGGTIYLAANVSGISGTLDLGLGATGGGGGDGNTIYAEQYGRVETFGGDADGVVLQSIGGGGGIGGSLGNDASTHKILDAIGKLKGQIKRFTDAGSSYEFTVDVGGSGGSGGDGNQVKYYHNGQIITQGAWADGVVLQSIGGGGGQGGSSAASGSEVTASVNVAVGGKGGSGGDGGEVAIWLQSASNNFITTHGYGAAGMLMQSIGGGGGQGGDGSDNQTGTLAIGGDGGGSGAAGGNGGQVNTYDTSDVTISTYGNDAAGFIAQSIGGGGGTGGVGSSSENTRVDGEELSVSVGGKGGVAGYGGTIGLTIGASISTSGQRSHGVLLQSIGGGGGYGVTGSVEGGLDVAVGGSGGSAGNGGSVTFQLTEGEGISTSGVGAFGLVAQSIGGGGGLAGDTTGGALSSTPVTFVSDGASGNGGVVDLTIDAPIMVSGDEAIGIVAQSIGGGGGIAGSGDGGTAGVMSSDGSGTGGEVDIVVSSTVAATGSQATGIFAQSEGSDGNGQINVNVSDTGSIQGGTTKNAAAVMVAGGKNNRLVLSDTAVVQSGASRNGVDYDSSHAVRFIGTGTAAEGAILNITVNDKASLYGDVVLTNASGGSAGTVTNNSFYTMADGYLYDAHVVNNGRFVLGRSRDPGTTEITGDFVQSENGLLVADIDLNNYNSDLLKIGGDATLAGTLGLETISLLPNRRTRFLTVSGTATGSLTPQNSLIFDYGLNAVANDFYFHVDGADFTPNGHAGLNGDQHAVAVNLQEIWDRGGNTVFGTLFGAVADAVDNDSRQYSDVLDQLLPRAAFAPVVEQSFEMLSFGDSLMSCPVFDGDLAGLSESSCGWARATAGTGHRAPLGGSPSYNANSLTYQLGGQREFAPDWYIGGAAAFQQNWISQASSTVQGSGTAGYLGASLKHEFGGWTVSGGLAGSYGKTDIDRQLSISNLSQTISSSPDVLAGSVKARIARTFAATNYYVKPYIDVDAIYTWVDDYKESGPYGLQFAANGQWNFAATPALEVGSRLRYKDGKDLRLYGKLGVSFLSNDSWETEARFTNGVPGTNTFSTSLEHEDIFAIVGAGLQLTSIEGVDLRLEYNGRFSESLSTNSGSLRLSVPF